MDKRLAKVQRMPSSLSVIANSLGVVQVDQDLQGKGAPVSPGIQLNAAHLGSLPNQDLALANHFLPPAQLRLPVTEGHDLP